MDKRSRLIWPGGIFLFILCLGIVGCTTQKVLAPVVEGGVEQPAPALLASQSTYYIVQRGDSLLSIAARKHTSAKTLIALNHLQTPYKLRVGQRLELVAPPLPPAPAKQETVEVKVNTKPALVMSKKPAPLHDKPATKALTIPPTLKSKPIVQKQTTEISQWQWPAQGRIIKGFSAQRSGSRGIDITNSYGTPVVATASGKVVYSGSGLAGYGNLIIIKHNDRYLSAYAHNKTILVKEGQQVTAGQEIAEMGRNAAGEVLLHFEIRRNGKPVNPLLYLKK